MQLKSWVRSYFNLGTRFCERSDQAYSVRVTNGTFLSASFLIAIVALIDVARLEFGEVLLDVVIISALQLPILCHAYGFVRLGRLLAIVVANLCATVNCFFYGTSDAVLMTFAPVAAISCCLVTPREYVLAFLAAVLPFVLAMTLPHLIHEPYFSDFDRMAVRNMSFVIVFTLIAVTVLVTNAVQYRQRAELRILMRQQRDDHARLFGAAKLASIGQMAAGVAHEINNPLTIIAGRSQMMKRILDGKGAEFADLSKQVHAISEMATRITRITGNLLELARPASEKEQKELVDLRIAVEDVVELSRSTLEREGLQVQVVAESTPLIGHGNRAKIQQIILGLFGNAVDALCDGPRPVADKWIRIEMGRQGDKVFVDVIDAGPGIESDLRAKIWEPFFTTKEVGKGSGLGLSISRNLALSMGGDLHYLDEHEYTAFRLEMPSPV